MLTRGLASFSLLVVVAAGCSSSATHGASPAPASGAPSAAAVTPSVEPTPSATPFVSSADEAGAKAFVVSYYAELDKAFASGDTSRLTPYRLATCICVKSETGIRSTYDAGGSIVGAKLTILKWAYGAHGPAFARTAIAFHATSLTDKMPGKKDVTEREVYGDYFIDLRRLENHWQISDIRFKEVPAP
jgi:hypothetical protein